MTNRAIHGVVILFLLMPSRGAAAAEPLAKIELEIATAPSADIAAQRRWYERLKGAKLGRLRLRQAREGESPSTTERVGQPGHYKVLAILTPGDRLLLPGRSFSRRDIAALKRYLIRLTEEGIDGVTAPRGAFGLTEQQFKQIHADLAQPIGFDTKDRPMGQVVERIAKAFALDVDIDPTAGNVLDRAKAIDELKGFTAGTGLSILLRAEGLALRPVLERGTLKHHIFVLKPGRADPQGGTVFWSPGHQPDGRLSQVLPILLEQLTVQIEGHTLTEALDALRGRIDAPFLFDHTALAEQNIEPDKVQVRFPAKRTFYKRVLDHILHQARLKGEVRVDEGGTVFYWITAGSKPRRR